MNPFHIARNAALCATIAAFTGSAAVAGAPRAACSLLSTAEVQGAIGFPVTVFQSSPPTGNGGVSVSTCSYGAADKRHTAFVSINHGEPAALTTLKQRVESSHRYRGSLVLHGDMLVSAIVRVDKEFDKALGDKLLAAAVKKL